MARLPPDSQFPEFGSRVGPWIVRERIGSGSHGTVFRAVHAERPEADSFALKLALTVGDARFEREAHLLSRVRHPSVPRLEGRGIWKSPRGEAYPYVVMQWVEGMNLYAWAQEYGLTLRHSVGHLAQVARALEATHRHGVHRDVKGGNVRVSPEGHAVLLDFGSCWYPGASPLTGGEVPPGTGPYRSPGMVFFEYALKLGTEGSYKSPPADDLYALGVMAYRLLAGTYPPDDSGSEDLTQKRVPLEAPRGLNEVCPELGELILRLLSEDPEARGSAREVAEELEGLREYSRPALDEPWVANASRQPTAKAVPPVPVEPAPPPVPREPAPPPVPREPAPPPVPREPASSEPTSRSASVGVGLVLVLLGVVLTLNVDPREVASTEPEHGAQAMEKPDAGTSLGEEGLASVTPVEGPYDSEGKLTSEIPDEPAEDQKRPPCNQRAAKEIKGGCWLPVEAERAPCDTGLYEYEGRCYYPMSSKAKRPPTSGETP